MHILMFGWEFPPWISGGLGTACFGITKALAGLGHRITFILPRAGEGARPAFLEMVCTADLQEPLDPLKPGPSSEPLLVFHPVASPLSPYLNDGLYRSLRRDGQKAIAPYGTDLITEVIRYGRAGGDIARGRRFDVIHAHDWMTIPAALRAMRISGKPLVLHIHSLEYDRSGEHVNEAIRTIEREGLEKADRIIAVSHRTRRMIVERYGISPGKISVVHNAVSQKEAGCIYRAERRGVARGQQMVLFLGRITFQKGPDYFVEAAARVLKVLPEVRFVMAGTGDRVPQMIERVAQLGIGNRFHFTGFLQGEEVERIFSLSDLYVMPSVSEPFGISPLEAMLYDVPVIISRQSGAAEVLRHALKVDFWNVREIASKIIAVLKYPVLAGEMAREGREELRQIRWETAAQRIADLYREAAAAGT
jgi:glycogen synthase